MCWFDKQNRIDRMYTCEFGAPIIDGFRTEHI